MRIALLNIDSLASNASTSAFIERHADKVVLVALSPAFRPETGGFFGQTARHMRRSGAAFSNFLAVNFLLPRLVGWLRPSSRTIGAACARHGIRLEAVRDVNAPQFRRLVTELEIDLIVTSFYDQILSPELIETPRNGAINVHISPLPFHRGPMPVIHGLIEEPAQLGVSVHVVEPSIDTGPLLAQRRYDAPPDASVLTIMRTLQASGLELAASVLADLEAGRATSVPQAAGSYQGFPTRSVLRRLKRRGRRLFDVRDIRLALGTGAHP